MNQKRNTLIIGVVIVLLVTLGLFGVYYLGIIRSKSKIENPTISSSQTTPRPTSSPAATSGSSLTVLNYKDVEYGTVFLGIEQNNKEIKVKVGNTVLLANNVTSVSNPR